jgi:hypothetical protein
LYRRRDRLCRAGSNGCGSSKCRCCHRDSSSNGFHTGRLKASSRIGSTRFEFAQLVFKVPAHPGAIFAFEVAQVFNARFEGGPLQLGITVGALHFALRVCQKTVGFSARLG